MSHQCQHEKIIKTKKKNDIFVMWTKLHYQEKNNRNLHGKLIFTTTTTTPPPPTCSTDVSGSHYTKILVWYNILKSDMLIKIQFKAHIWITKHRSRDFSINTLQKKYTKFQQIQLTQRLLKQLTVLWILAQIGNCF